MWRVAEQGEDLDLPHRGCNHVWIVGRDAEEHGATVRVLARQGVRSTERLPVSHIAKDQDVKGPDACAQALEAVHGQLKIIWVSTNAVVD